MPHTAWRLAEILEREQIPVYRLAEATRGGLSRNTVYQLAKQEPARLELATITTLITALRELTGQPIDVTDLLAYRPNGRGEPSTAKQELASGPEGPAR